MRERTRPRVELGLQLDYFVVPHHLCRCDNNAMTGFVVLDLRCTVKPWLTNVTLKKLHVQCALPALVRVDLAWLWVDHLRRTRIPICSPT